MRLLDMTALMHLSPVMRATANAFFGLEDYERSNGCLMI
jgi:hypothetical protein